MFLFNNYILIKRSLIYFIYLICWLEKDFNRKYIGWYNVFIKNVFSWLVYIIRKFVINIMCKLNSMLNKNSENYLLWVGL